MAKKNNKKPEVPLPVDLLENVVDLYIRVSTTEQAEEGYSVGEQENRLRSYAAAMGYKINAVHVDPGYSGATLDRPGIKQVINDVRSGRCRKVIVWKLDRLSRSQKDTLILLEDVFLSNNCNFVSIIESFDTSTPFGRCMVGILAAFAQMERENIKLRTMMGKQAGLKEGNYYAGTAPIGYRYEMQENGKRALVVDPFTSQAVRDIYRLYNSGRSCGEVLEYVREKYGIFPTRTDRSSGSFVITRILKNSVYAGRVSMGGQEYPGKHEALVTPEAWKMANDRLEKNQKNFNRAYVRSNGILCGILYCGDCGARMSIRKWGYKHQIDKYVCYSVSRSNKRMVKSENCTNRKNHFNVSDLDNIVLNEIKKLSLDPAVLDSLIEESKQEAPDLESFGEHLAEVEKQITRLLNLYQTGAIDLAEIQDRLSDLKEEREKIQNTISELEAKTPQKMSKSTALAALDSLPSVISSEDPAALYALVHSLIEKVVVYNGDVTIHWAFC